MIPELIPTPGLALCSFAQRWGISNELAQRLHQMQWDLEFPVSIISGLRSEEEQNALRGQGRPAADNDKSTHLTCPATGADVMPQIAITNYVKARLGAEGVLAGMRWGGGGAVDPETGIPRDWPHFDLGPR